MKELKTSETIAFRMEKDARRALTLRADALGVSPHELARHYVLEMLSQGEERSALRDAIVEIHKEVHNVRTNLMITTQAILTSAGKVKADEAEAWVTKVFEGK